MHSLNVLKHFPQLINTFPGNGSEWIVHPSNPLKPIMIFTKHDTNQLQSSSMTPIFGDIVQIMSCLLPKVLGDDTVAVTRKLFGNLVYKVKFMHENHLFGDSIEFFISEQRSVIVDIAELFFFYNNEFIKGAPANGCVDMYTVMTEHGHRFDELSIINRETMFHRVILSSKNIWKGDTASAQKYHWLRRFLLQSRGDVLAYLSTYPMLFSSKINRAFEFDVAVDMERKQVLGVYPVLQ